jgi:copper(I)-binding protein
MATFASVWAVRCDTPQNEGDTVTVTTKAGKAKQIKLGAFLRKETSKYDGDSFLYLPVE